MTNLWLLTAISWAALGLVIWLSLPLYRHRPTWKDDPQ